MSEVLRRAKHTLSVKQYQSLLNQYAATQSLSKTKALHCHVITNGRASDHILSTLSVTYALCGHIAYARKLFDVMPESSLLSYNIVIRMYVRDGLYQDAVNTFVKMVGEGTKCCPDGYTYPFVAKAAGELKSVPLGLVIHGRVLRSWFGADKYVQNALLAMYMSFGRVEMARRVFDVMMNRDVISWNTMISGYYRNGYMNDALMTFDRMVDEGVGADHATVVSMLPVCGHLKDLEMGRNVHKLVDEKRLGDKIEVKNALVNMYLKCGRMDEARFVFDRMERRDVITWTSMINGYTEDGDVKNALELCRLMQFDGVRPNDVTIASLVSACGDALELNDGKCLHGWAIRQRVHSSVIIETSLISMYAKCSRVDLCFKVFSGASKNQTGPWSAIIASCVHNELMSDALDLFKGMRREDVEPNIATLNSLLPAYAALADLRQAMDIHCYLTKTGFTSSLDAATGLVHVYSKCGTLESAHKIFDGIQEKHKSKDIVLWGALISGYGMHGDGHNALQVFMEMVRSGVTPNEITFTSALNACSHSGLVEQGLTQFRFMLEHHNKIARPNHYTCMVDLLGRAGRLEEAYNLITTIPFEPTSTVWGALLAACVTHENVQLGEIAANKLFELEPENTGNYVLLSNIYAALGRWKDMEKVRKMMEDVGLRKKPGHSTVEFRQRL
ncbi:PREDICTED: pentatricopeptide repeat-containing protein At5g39350 [Brassica oleracea var. oleracea]|uniref:Pentacotripeptide-repeat region of PRORP domain-containing protein n=1 Tax=Brassica oleracea var. oleracea TaxID=109376 RepID=A0A0D3BZT4_BRAOL|nr:PREDICTED: pentatricopeptide repeat-containing protein At5g39350 [Brassica oleracea var. oleracea]